MERAQLGPVEHARTTAIVEAPSSGRWDAKHFAKRVAAAKLPGHLMAEVAPLLVVMQQLSE